MPKAPHYPVPALEKGLDILETLASAAVPQSLSELAARLERSSSELFRMLNCLEVRGYITREPLSGKYSLTLKLFSLAHAHSVADKLLRAAHAPMQELSEKIHESCHLSILERGKLLVLAQHESPERVRVSIEVGAQFDPVSTASGRLLLAYLETDARHTVLQDSPAGRGLKARELTAFQQSLEAMRSTGLSMAESETIQGVRDLAVMVGNPALGITAALAVTRLMKRGQLRDESSIIADMRKAAAAITGTLGLVTAA